MKWLIGIGAVLVIFAAVMVNGYLDFSNSANNFENQINAQYKQNQNVYDNGWKKVQEVAQVPEMYTESVKKVFVSAIQGRYGANGATATFAAIQEANPNIDSSLFLRVQQVVEDFHNRFEESQKRLLSIKQEYDNLRTATTGGRLYNTFGHYPHLDLTKFDIVTSDETESAFQTKKAGALKLSH